MQRLHAESATPDELIEAVAAVAGPVLIEWQGASVPCHTAEEAMAFAIGARAGAQWRARQPAFDISDVTPPAGTRLPPEIE